MSFVIHSYKKLFRHINKSRIITVTTDITVHFDNIAYPVNVSRLKNICNWLLKQCGVSSFNLSVLLVNDQEMARLNNHYRGKNIATNVLSFPLTAGEDYPALPAQKELGDIIVSVDTALRESIEYCQTLNERLSWLLIHGLLHLLGYDHEKSDRERKRMEKKEQLLLTRLQDYRRNKMAKLAINIDHVATIRQARDINEPDPVTAASICELAGAAGIVIHLREDRRHIQDRDVHLLRKTVKTKLNLEMGANKEIIQIALKLKPDLITLVPEKRRELTTEGGLDVATQKKKIGKVVEKMAKASIPVSIFADPDLRQLKAAKDVGATFVEIHTGKYSDATSEKAMNREYQLIVDATEKAYELGLRVCAGHGLNYRNCHAIAAIDTIEELSIGHAIMARAIFTGLDQAVREMLAIVRHAAI